MEQPKGPTPEMLAAYQTAREACGEVIELRHADHREIYAGNRRERRAAAAEARRKQRRQAA